MMLLSSGNRPKQIAAHLGILHAHCPCPQQPHPGQDGARSIADLVRMVDTLGTCVEHDA
jgi:hypothetical protein